MMPENLKQLHDRLDNCVEKIKVCRGERADITSQHNFDINFIHSFNLAEIMRELTKMSDERVTELKDFSAFAMKISPSLSHKIGRQDLQEDTKNDIAVEMEINQP